MNPILRKLRRKNLSPADVAQLLEKHIGDGSNEFHCRQACEALRTIRREDTRSYAQFIDNILNGVSTRCEVVKRVISALRSADVAEVLVAGAIPLKRRIRVRNRSPRRRTEVQRNPFTRRVRVRSK